MLDKGLCLQYKDEELVAEILVNQEFYCCLIERYEAPLKRYINRITNLADEEIEDLLQDIFLKTYLNLNDFDKTLKFSSWIYRITHNEVISHHRKRKSRHLDEHDPLEDWQELAANFSQEEQLDQQIKTEKLGKILALMDGKYREVLILKYLEEKSYEEISDILQKPLGTVATLINRAKKQFKIEVIDKKIDF